MKRSGKLLAECYIFSPPQLMRVREKDKRLTFAIATFVNQRKFKITLQHMRKHSSHVYSIIPILILTKKYYFTWGSGNLIVSIDIEFGKPCYKCEIIQPGYAMYNAIMWHAHSGILGSTRLIQYCTTKAYLFTAISDWNSTDASLVLLLNDSFINHGRHGLREFSFRNCFHELYHVQLILELMVTYDDPKSGEIFLLSNDDGDI
ncbi:hypothetical protein ACJX0J_013553 [Zea mays]